MCSVDNHREGDLTTGHPLYLPPSVDFPDYPFWHSSDSSQTQPGDVDEAGNTYWEGNPHVVVPAFSQDFPGPNLRENEQVDFPHTRADGHPTILYAACHPSSDEVAMFWAHPMAASPDHNEIFPTAGSSEMAAGILGQLPQSETGDLPVINYPLLSHVRSEKPQSEQYPYYGNQRQNHWDGTSRFAPCNSGGLSFENREANAMSDCMPYDVFGPQAFTPTHQPSAHPIAIASYQDSHCGNVGQEEDKGSSGFIEPRLSLRSAMKTRSFAYPTGNGVDLGMGDPDRVTIYMTIFTRTCSAKHKRAVLMCSMPSSKSEYYNVSGMSDTWTTFKSGHNGYNFRQEIKQIFEEAQSKGIIPAHWHHEHRSIVDAQILREGQLAHQEHTFRHE